MTIVHLKHLLADPLVGPMYKPFLSFGKWDDVFFRCWSDYTIPYVDLLSGELPSGEDNLCRLELLLS